MRRSRRQALPRVAGARERKRALAFAGRSHSSLGESLGEFFLGLELQRQSQHPADLALIDECKVDRPRPKKLFAAILAGARWERGRDCDDCRLAIHCAALRCRDPKAWELMERLGADFMAPDACGNHFFHWAMAEANLPAIEWWVRSGRPVRDLNSDGLLPIELCLVSYEPELALTLSSAFPDHFPESDLTGALSRLDLIAAAKSSLFPGPPAAESVFDCLSQDPARVSASRELSETLDRLGIHSRAALARSMESVQIAKAEREDLLIATPRPEPLARPRFL